MLAGPAADVEHFALGGFDPFPARAGRAAIRSSTQRASRICLPSPKDRRTRLPSVAAIAEPGDPALVLDAELRGCRRCSDWRNTTVFRP